jgi:hypothetical protein
VVFEARDEDETVSLAAVELDTFEVLFPTDVVFANPEEVKVGPVGPAVIVEYFRTEEVELLCAPALLGPAVVELASKVIVETKLVEVDIAEVLLTFAAWY